MEFDEKMNIDTIKMQLSMRIWCYEEAKSNKRIPLPSPDDHPVPNLLKGL